MPPLKEREFEIVLQGGIDTKEALEIEEGTVGFRALENYRYGTALGRLERPPMDDEPIDVVAPAGNKWLCPMRARTLFKRGDELAALTDHEGVVRFVDPGAGILAPRYLTGRATSSAPVESYLTAGPAPCATERKLLHSVDSFADNALGMVCVTGTATLDWLQYVVAWVERRVNSLDAVLHMRAYSIVNDTEADVASRMVVLTGEIGASVSISSCPYRDGAIVTVATGAGGTIIPIHVYEYLRGTARFTGPTTMISNARSWRHTIARGDTGQLHLGFINSAGNLEIGRWATYTGAASSLWNTGHAARVPSFVFGLTPGLPFVVSNTSTTLYIDQVTGPTTGVSVSYPGAGTEIFLGVEAQYMPNANGSFCFAIFLTINDTTTRPAVRVMYREMRWQSPTAGLYTVITTRSIPNCFVLAKPQLYEGRLYAPLAPARYESPGKLTTGFLTRVIANENWAGPAVEAVAKFCHERCWGYPNPDLPAASAFWMQAPGVMYAVTLADSSIDSFSGIGRMAQTIALNKLSLIEDLPHPSVEKGPTTLLSAGFLAEYDGIRCTESQPHITPAVRETGTGMFVTAIYTWADAAGQLHRSAPAEPVQHSIGTIVYVEVPALTGFDGAMSPSLGCQLYTSTDGLNFYLAQLPDTSIDHPDAITPEGCFYRFDNVQAPDLSAPPLYTNGGELASDPPPPFLHVGQVSDRLIGIDAEDRTRVFHSKPAVAGYADEWSSLLYSTVPDQCEAGVGLVGQPFVLARGGIYTFSGAGPDSQGVGFYSPAIRLHTLGCVSRASVCVTPHGAVFQCVRGFVLLSNGGELVKIGQPIESLTTPEVFVCKRVLYDAHTDSLTISSSDKRYFFSFPNNAWGSESLGAVLSADQILLSDGTSYYARSALGADGFALVPQTETASDAPSMFETPWIKTNGVAGFQRLWEFLQGLRTPVETRGPGPATTALAPNITLQIELYLDYQTVAPSSVFTFEDPHMEQWNHDEVIALKLKPRVQRCRAFKLRVRVFSDADVKHSGFVPLFVRVRAGVDRSQQTRPSRRSAP